VVGADGFATILEELFEVHGDGQALEVAASLGCLACPLRGDGRSVDP